jgi:hypothetical protein
MGNIIELHLKATFAKPSGLAWGSDGIMAFHVVLYVICQEGAFDHDENWSHGRLYGPRIQQKVFTVSISLIATVVSLIRLGLCYLC